MPRAREKDDGGRPKPSLRTELLFNLAFLAAGALVLAVVSAILAPLFGRTYLGFVLLTVLIAADVFIFIAFGRYLVARLVTGPMDTLVDATQAVAEGELSRRAPPGGTRELDRLAESVNRMTERLLDAQGALVRAEKLASVGRLAAGVAHEVGNPLSAIGNYLELLHRRGADAELVAALEREVARIDIIVRSLLDYARPRGDERQPVDVAEVVRGAVELLEAQGVLRDVSVEVAAEAGVPRVLGDGPSLEQVCVNLLLNAVDAAATGGRITVAVRSGRTPAPAGAHEPGPAAVIEVMDSGPGVAADHVDRIFDPFFTTKPPGSGTGLGLAIVQRIVEDHGGRVDVARSALGGAAFTVTLPGMAP